MNAYFSLARWRETRWLPLGCRVPASFASALFSSSLFELPAHSLADNAYSLNRTSSSSCRGCWWRPKEALTHLLLVALFGDLLNGLDFKFIGKLLVHLSSYGLLIVNQISVYRRLADSVRYRRIYGV